MVNGILPNGAKVGFSTRSALQPDLIVTGLTFWGINQIAPLAFWGMQRTADCMSSEQCNFCASHGTIAQSTSPRAPVHAFATDRQSLPACPPRPPPPASAPQRCLQARPWRHKALRAAKPANALTQGSNRSYNRKGDGRHVREQ